METEKNKKYGCRIFCVCLPNDFYDDKTSFEKIAEFGGTKHCLNANSLESLYRIFNEISDTIQKIF